MSIQITYQPNSANVHQGPGFLAWNILRPLFSMRPIPGPSTPLQISDPATPAAWVLNNAYAVGAMCIDSNANIELVTAVAGTGTSGATHPTWPTAVGGTVVDNSGTNQITWRMVGPTWVWVAGMTAIPDQQIRDANGNILQCIFPGTCGNGSAPVGGLYGAPVQDGAAIWMNLGPSIFVGANEGAIDFNIMPKMSPIKADDFTAPMDFVTTGEDGDITGKLMELLLSTVAKVMPNTSYSSGTDPNFPANAQNFQELTFGGQTRVPRPCVGCFSYRRQFGDPLNSGTNPYKWFGGVLYAVGPSSPGKFPFSLEKPTVYDVACKASVVTWRPVGDMIGQFWDQL
jgi:hypothetical protein